MATYKFKLESQDNLEAFLTELGVPEDRRKAALESEVTLEITKADDGTVTFTTTYGTRSFSYSYKTGEEFTYERPNGQKVKGLVTKDNDHQTTTVEDDGKNKITHVRNWGDGKLKSVSTVNGVTATQVYVKV